MWGDSDDAHDTDMTTNALHVDLMFTFGCIFGFSALAEPPWPQSAELGKTP